MNKFRKLSEHVKILEYGKNDNPVLGYIYGSKRALISDGGSSKKQIEKFYANLTKEEKDKVAAGLITHHHWDHTFGAGYIGKDIYCGEKTAKYIEEYSKSKWDAADIESKYSKGQLIDFSYRNMKAELKGKPVIFAKPKPVGGSLGFELGGVSAVYEPIESCHCDDAYVLYVQEDKVLFLGDILWPDMEGEYRNWYYDLKTVKDMYERLKKYNAEIYIDSHDDPMDSENFNGFMRKLIFMLEYKAKNKASSIDEVWAAVPDELKGFTVCYEDLLTTAIENVK